jgi:hypothetical protein
LLTLALLVIGPAAARAQRWSVEPLNTSTPLPRGELPTDRQVFLRWIQQSGLSDQQVQAARELLFAFVAMETKRARGAFVQGDTALATLFRAAAGLGIAGAADVYQALMPAATPVRAAPLPTGVTLTFQAPNFTLASADSSWSLCVPHYFMAAPLGRQILANGVQTELAVVSTLTAADSSPAGASQATMLIAAAPPSDSTAHVNLWLQQLRLNPGRPLASAGFWYSAGPNEPMRRIAVVRRLPRRVVLITYHGVCQEHSSLISRTTSMFCTP